MSFISEHNLLIFLLQFALLLGCSKLIGMVFARFKQSTITAEVLVGLLLGPAIFGRHFPLVQAYLFPPDALQISMLETVAWIGNFYLLMETGLDVNFNRIWKQRGQALTISVTDMIVPLLLAVIPIFFLPDRYLIDPSKRVIFSIFIATIMTVSALPAAIRVMYDLNILKTDTGFLIVSALTVNDLLGWVIFTIILGIFSQAQLELVSMVRLVVFTIAFTVISLSLFRRYVDKTMTVIHEKFGDDTGMKTTFVFIVGMFLGAMTSGIGIHSLFGFFIAGIIIGEAKHFSQNDRHVMNRLVHSVFVPVFFANIGLHLDIVKSFDWKLVVFFTLIGICVRYCGAYLGSIFAKQNRLNRSTIAICHTAGGEMHIVVALLAFSSGLITHSIFVGIVAASILSTVVFGPWLAYNLKKKRQSLLHVVFQPEAILLNQNFPDKPSLMTAVSDLVSARIGISPENIYQEIQTREEQMSTAMGKGLAFPHARLKNLTQPLIYLIRNGIGLEWDSPDAKPVQLIFFILTPDDNPTIQLYILQTLAKALSDNTIREILDKSDRQEEIWARLKPEIESCEKCFVNV